MRPILIFIAMLIAAPAAHAQATTAPAGQAPGTLGDLAGVVFKEAEKRIIEEYFGKRADEDDDEKDKGKNKKNRDKDKGKEKKAKGQGRGHGLPQGLAKRDQLPPGLAKRGNRLPPGLMKADLPPDLEQKLPKLQDTLERIIVDNDVVLVQKGTNLILDVLSGVLRGQ